MTWHADEVAFGFFLGAGWLPTTENEQGNSEPRKSSIFRPVVELSYLAPVSHAISRVSPVILVVEALTTTTSPYVWRTGSAHATVAQLVSKGSASIAEYM